MTMAAETEPLVTKTTTQGHNDNNDNTTMTIVTTMAAETALRLSRRENDATSSAVFCFHQHYRRAEVALTHQTRDHEVDNWRSRPPPGLNR